MSFSDGILLLNKPKTKTSFYLVILLRKLTNIRKIGHAGTLDPLATGVMVMLIGKKYTQMTPNFILHDKEYHTLIELGKETDTYDTDGQVLKTSLVIPSLTEIQNALINFQGTILQTPPMYSAKKHKGKKLYELARKGEEVERKPKEIQVQATLLSYNYPYLELKIACSSGSYIRSIAHDLGILLNCGACVSELTRVRSGPYTLSECISVDQLNESIYAQHLRNS